LWAQFPFAWLLPTLFTNGAAMLKRILQNPKTSVLAGILFMLAFILVWFGKATLTEAGVFLPAIIGLLWAKD
jgi:hypothetical protein